MNKNECYKLEIVDISSEGMGVGKHDNCAVFVPNTIMGDVVEAKIIKVAKNYAVGKLLEIIEPSEFRKDTSCEIAGKCGGCQLQNVTYTKQLDWKRKRVQDAIKRIGKLDGITVLPTIGMDEPSHYRNKAQYPIRKVDGKIQIGFFEKRSHTIVDLNECMIQDSRNTEIIKIVRNFLEQNNISIYKEETHKGLVRHLLIKTSYHFDDIMVCVVVNGEKLPHSDKLVDGLKNICSSICINVNTTKGNTILGNKSIVLFGEEYIEDKIGELTFKISPLTFFQVNPLQTEVLYSKAFEFARLTGSETVFDVYCGIGTISLFVAKQAKKVYGVEIVESAIENAKQNAVANGIENAEFFVGKAEDVVTDLYGKGATADVVIVDPPRKGCDEKLLDTIMSMSPKRIVYVSCDPATLARDLAYIKGYAVEVVQPVDMFPHTNHVENVVLLSKVE
ncbi:MAG: 23S rRNA (uracil-5-)-methyltransferase RumA [Epulopiscium sp. Nele67-Bin004]|nr:MAG: 23S rRNA (uracil-5-)-methyltransferase RumA [Epulopiscium sp. Nele67-Bin004]